MVEGYDVFLESDRGGVLNLFVDGEDDLRFGNCVEDTASTGSLMGSTISASATEGTTMSRKRVTASTASRWASRQADTSLTALRVDVVATRGWDAPLLEARFTKLLSAHSAGCTFALVGL